MGALRRLAGGGLFARAMRGSLVSVAGQIVSQGVRLLSNLLLTRLLFPEAFGMMALVQMVLVGLFLMSDVGLVHAIGGNKRGDDPDFLNTAWTIQVIRGGLLWGLCCLIALPLAHFYEAPELALILPVSGVGLLISGFITTRFDGAVRHLALGKVTIIDLSSQLIGIVAMIVLAYSTGSVWALVWGGLISSVVKVALAQVWLPGHRNSFRWEPAAAKELLGFGAWTFLSSTCSFFLMQGDKAVLGRWLSLEALGVYNVGFSMASFPSLLFQSVTGRVFVPLYRGVREQGTESAHRRLRLLRLGLTGAMLLLLGFMAMIGVPFMALLYDARYEGAGAVMVLFACAQMPTLITGSYEMAALSAGDSRSVFLAHAVRAIVQTSALLLGVQMGGQVGAVVGLGLAGVICMPCGIWLARKHGVHDPLHDIGYLGLAFVFWAMAAWLWSPQILALMA